MGNLFSRSTSIVSNRRLDGKTVIVTGSNTGIGKITARELYRLGARVIMACRDVTRAQDAVTDIKNDVKKEESVGELIVQELNLASFKSIRSCADRILETEGAIHLLINNAGVMMCAKSKTEDGFETHFGVNHLGHFLFTCLLLPKIIKSSPSKVINISSSVHTRGQMFWNDLNYENRPYSALGAYCQSKLANILFTKELAERLKDKGVDVYSLHPGIVKTDLGRHLDQTYFPGARALARFIFFPIFLTPEEGAKTTIHCALLNEGVSGGYYIDCKLKESSVEARNPENAKILWNESIKMVHLDVDPFDSVG